MSRPIADYAMLGDCESCALVARDGSVDWLCWPRFDSAACFAALLGDDSHGTWQLGPLEAGARAERRYRQDTLILETVHETPEGAVRVVDLMPPGGGGSKLVRIVRGLRGAVAMRCALTLRFDYGLTVPWVTRTQEGALRAVAGPWKVVLRSSIPLEGEGLSSAATFTIGEGEVHWFVLAHSASHLQDPEPVDPFACEADTETFWRDWAAQCTYRGPWREIVLRSLLTLKALTFAPSGGIIAAPTTSLPEWLGGTRNWDYRYCWLRDSTFTLLALTDAGFLEEAGRWRDWLLRAVAGSPEQIQIMYGASGERMLPELELDWLPGYAGSRPVRIGNGAARQIQLDVYGEIADALYQAHSRGLAPDDQGWQVGLALIEHLELAWRQPDEGIWEVRGGPRHFVHSKVMAWVAFDRFIRAAERSGRQAPVARWKEVRHAIHEEVCRHGFDRDLGSFVQSYGSRKLDASLLLLPLVGFLPPSDPRIRGTLRAIEAGLVRDGFVLRYESQDSVDGLPPGEGAFLPCSFWLADNLIQQGRCDEAKSLLERLMAVANDVGLLAEEVDPRNGALLGNFPQAFSHVGLVNTILNYHRTTGPADERADAADGSRSRADRTEGASGTDEARAG